MPQPVPPGGAALIPDAERLDLFRRGEAFLLDALAGLSDEELLAPCRLEGWSRRHLVSHLARNADALGNLLAWARTGVETPMYGSADERASRIDEDAQRPPDVIRTDALAASARLVVAVAALPDPAWDAPVRTARNRPIDAGEVPWMRIRESWVHTVDLDVGLTFADVPTTVVDALLAEVTAGLADHPACPPLLLVEPGPTGRLWRIGPAASATPSPAATGSVGPDTAFASDPVGSAGSAAPAVEVVGSAADLLAWLIGRTDGTGLQATTPDSRPPKPPAWL
ncbi:MAG TPA: maleylpyruvate isomerase family mycothiol-dependent enzyme [Acidimicrobiales bacterium]|nr:maleylpyruvate isomerase family mycothiol-dependent enzyme [Acidimicrobiales bacterium]